MLDVQNHLKPTATPERDSRRRGAPFKARFPRGAFAFHIMSANGASLAGAAVLVLGALRAAPGAGETKP